MIGEDDKYPKDRRGKPQEPTKFTIRAEKCPNRKGVSEVLKHFQGLLINFDEVAKMASEGRLKALYFVSGFPPREWQLLTPEQTTALKSVPALIVQDVYPSELSAAATVVFPVPPLPLTTCSCTWGQSAPVWSRMVPEGTARPPTRGVAFVVG